MDHSRAGSEDVGHRSWLHIGDDVTYFVLEERQPNAPSPHEPCFHHGLNHFGMIVDGVEALCERMEATGYRKGASWDQSARLRRCWYDPEAMSGSSSSI